VGTYQLLIFRIASRFNMAYSPLGKLIRKQTNDAYRAENLFILAAATLIIALMLANQFAWAFIREEVLANPQGDVAITYWLVQLSFIVTFLFGCVVGFKPVVTITCTSSSVNIQSGDLRTAIGYDEIQQVKIISADLFHRHYRRYKATMPVINGTEQQYALLVTEHHPVVLGLCSADLDAFVQHVEAQRIPVSQDFSIENRFAFAA